jgi:hypothetical protein
LFKFGQGLSLTTFSFSCSQPVVVGVAVPRADGGGRGRAMSQVKLSRGSSRVIDVNCTVTNTGRGLLSLASGPPSASPAIDYCVVVMAGGWWSRWWWSRLWIGSHKFNFCATLNGKQSRLQHILLHFEFWLDFDSACTEYCVTSHAHAQITLLHHTRLTLTHNSHCYHGYHTRLDGR